MGGFQLTTDGLPWYAHAVENIFGIDVDYAVIQKHHGSTGDTQTSARYSPAKLNGFVVSDADGVLSPTERKVADRLIHKFRQKNKLS